MLPAGDCGVALFSANRPIKREKLNRFSWARFITFLAVLVASSAVSIKETRADSFSISSCAQSLGPESSFNEIVTFSKNTSLNTLGCPAINDLLKKGRLLLPKLQETVFEQLYMTELRLLGRLHPGSAVYETSWKSFEFRWTNRLPSLREEITQAIQQNRRDMTEVLSSRVKSTKSHPSTGYDLLIGSILVHLSKSEQFQKRIRESGRLTEAVMRNHIHDLERSLEVLYPEFFIVPGLYEDILSMTNLSPGFWESLYFRTFLDENKKAALSLRNSSANSQDVENLYARFNQSVLASLKTKNSDLDKLFERMERKFYFAHRELQKSLYQQYRIAKESPEKLLDEEHVLLYAMLTDDFNAEEEQTLKCLGILSRMNRQAEATGRLLRSGELSVLSTVGFWVGGAASFLVAAGTGPAALLALAGVTFKGMSILALVTGVGSAVHMDYWAASERNRAERAFVFHSSYDHDIEENLMGIGNQPGRDLLIAHDYLTELKLSQESARSARAWSYVGIPAMAGGVILPHVKGAAQVAAAQGKLHRAYRLRQVANGLFRFDMAADGVAITYSVLTEDYLNALLAVSGRTMVGFKRPFPSPKGGVSK